MIQVSKKMCRKQGWVVSTFTSSEAFEIIQEKFRDILTDEIEAS